jgi:hypothetical protein
MTDNLMMGGDVSPRGPRTIQPTSPPTLSKTRSVAFTVTISWTTMPKKTASDVSPNHARAFVSFNAARIGSPETRCVESGG